ncbi:PREDICTED: uncharacterized protein LOC105958028 [Erythranthe guttata]|uniref:uncharacterized protein LOC105958028 n=1 Tax=Erythranthe guttata TaxID=4155 RepID=UPI00064DDBCC|nr:PREDICTED: uncharacterized protein LOC105958028 [Erythranthe guttata]|eukprot:XP_012837482.1 PREDICTED: uncharacterized protein LOC105958028 [Erythranthe guttata]
MDWNRSAGTSNRSSPKDEFTDLVLSWSLQDICNDNLYKDQVEKIPKSFESVDTYLGSYIFPLLEETRAELRSATETVCNAPSAEVASFTERTHGKFVYNVKVGQWRNVASGSGSERHRILPGDVVLLSDSNPEANSRSQLIGGTYIFACINNIKNDDSFVLKTAEQIETEDVKKRPRYVIHLMNIIPHKRIWKALRMRWNLNLVEKSITANDLGVEMCEVCPFQYNVEMEEKLRSSLSSKLNESQLDAISACLSKSECSHTSSVELIWGPPGTGKTSTLSNLLHLLLKKNVRTLVCAPTNVAVKELASRVVALVRNSVLTESRGNLLPCPLGDMFIFGNNDRLKVGADIEEIYLDYRVKKLVHCLSTITGWKHCVASMLDFLEDCVSHHQIFVENNNGLIKSLLEFARDRFANLAPPLRDCMSTLITHLPTSFVREQMFRSIMQLMSLLDSIETLLFDDKSSLTSEELERIFLQDGTNCVDTSSIIYIRSQCLNVLRSVRASLDKLGLPNGVGITSTSADFCFGNATLIFCTTSTAYTLHKCKTELFKMLVIDEAAQVKECESNIALQIPGLMHAVLVGDEYQLPATVKSKISEKAGFGRSMFERLSLLGHPKHLLNVQYRMHPSISRFPNSSFYRNQILDAPIVQCRSYERCYLQGRIYGPYSFINIPGSNEEFDDFGRSRRNMVEVAVAVMLVHKLFKGMLTIIGLISPYAAQVAAIQDKVQRKYGNLEKFIVNVKSIDGFQGGEEDIIIISTVRSSKGGSIGFLSSPQRTNVALTRARHCLWILGNERTLSESDAVWKALISDAKEHDRFFTADEDCDIQKAIVDVKKELEQLEDLLSGNSPLFKNSSWKVVFSENFRKSFQKLNPSNVKNLAITVLLKLASGWRPKNINVDWKCESSSYIVKQIKVANYYVVCSIDLVKDPIYVQIFKVWDILPMTETTKLLKRLDSIFAMYTDDFINRCNEKMREGNLEVPKSWSVSDDIIRFKNQNETKVNSSASVECRSHVENAKVNESLLLMKFYSLSSDVVNHLLTDVEGREVDLPFEVTDEERAIIMFPRSSFILGRSGTGKTTILTMKLYQKLHQYSIATRDSMTAGDVAPILHQLFVTVSPKLCYAVKKHVSHLKSFASENASENNNLADMDDLDEMAEFRDIPDTFVGIEPEKYPLIITFHKFLMMLDGTLGNSYFERFRDVRGSSQYEGRRSIALQTFIRRNEVTYDRFRSLYWPHFNAKHTKILDPSRVFTEIMSHIKGSLKEGESGETKRSREGYVSLSESRVSTLCAEKRDAIYDIFDDYEKMKVERGEFDLADFVIDIHLRLKNEEDLMGDKMDFVYIDEVQDLTMRQISLFRFICKNVDEGYVFCGDTAQTIARGIDFRFEDIRSLFYNEFFMKSSRICEPSASGRREKGVISDTFCLSQNFRTHTGVLRLAQSVIDLICHFFPQSIDALAPETSLIYGESPVVLEPGSDENLIMSIFGHSGHDGGKWVGFGADQVILVRDDSARNEIFNYIGKQALVLTIVECKGLEFQDVLLYNFFGSSPMSDQWRVLYEFLKEKDLLDSTTPKSFPSFSESRHNILCSELKQLYVAITRTRQRLWICENNEELLKPILDYWRRLCLVQVRKIDDSLAFAMQRASSPEEWKSQGVKLFWEKNYEMATVCFEKAGEETWEKRAKASGLRASADSMRGSNPKEARVMLREAAEIFDSIDRADTAAECFCDLGEYERAGRIYLEKCGTSELRKAGECFLLAGNYKLATEVYNKGNFFDECLSACTKGNHFDLGLRYIEQWKQQASFDTEIIAQQFLEKCALECRKKKDSASMMKFVRAFCTDESKRNFLKSRDCLEELLILEEDSGNFIEAVQIAQQLGHTLREIDLLEKAKDFRNASLLVISYVLNNSLWVNGSKGWPLKSFPEKEEILAKAISDAKKVSENFHASICAEAKFLSMSDRMNLSELMHCYSASKQYKSRVVEILSVRKFLDAHFQVHPTKYESDPQLMLIDRSSFEERMSKNKVSDGTLVFVCNLWKVQSLEIFECLDSIERADLSECEDTARFCFNYFGVRSTNNSSDTCILLNPNSAWIRNSDKRFILRKRNVATLDARDFASAAREYWCQEIVSTGLRVLEALQSRLMKLSLSMYCQSVCLVHIFDITRFVESKSLTMKLQKFLSLCVESKYFQFVFPLDPRQSVSEDMLWAYRRGGDDNARVWIIAEKRNS